MFTEEEFDLMTHALVVLGAAEPGKFVRASELHSKLIFNKEQYVITRHKAQVLIQYIKARETLSQTLSVKETQFTVSCKSCQLIFEIRLVVDPTVAHESVVEEIRQMAMDAHRNIHPDCRVNEKEFEIHAN